MPLTKGNQEIYTHLAKVYDEVMKDIDYEDWADFIDEIIQNHNNEATTILELACGTGSLAISLDELDCYEITASDYSEQMLEVAEQKASIKQSNITWKRIDFFQIDLKEKFDVVVMLFDSLNYIKDTESIKIMLNEVKKVLKKDGFFIFDFTTPQHSSKYADMMNDQGITFDNYRFVRISRYLEAEGVHYNEFTIEKLSDDKQQVLARKNEVHVQRTYKLDDIRSVVNDAGFKIIAEYDGLDFVPATNQSDRITMVIQ
ncbi:MAG TPA: class I SAM-dependent methyltransferase [Bacteroidetes bacterium]|nr:class I SAM-dependent methyltransferase [Bacteroidota bacterium]